MWGSNSELPLFSISRNSVSSYNRLRTIPEGLALSDSSIRSTLELCQYKKTHFATQISSKGGIAKCMTTLGAITDVKGSKASVMDLLINSRSISNDY